MRFCEHGGEVLGSVHCENLKDLHLSAAQDELCCIELLKIQGKRRIMKIRHRISLSSGQ
jgi:hypothetical protein